ncbi:MAG: NAD-dependent epimerase/dehydratase family protein [Dehalococcoidia bacterium]|nr:MAG: NAD-dependent epimerase/dehydratase family protein [Dehalococcoidia bacterium]
MAEAVAAALSGRRVLVTGAAGLVGSNLVPRLLDAGAEVTVLLRDLDGSSPLAAVVAAGRVRTVRGTLVEYVDVERALVESEAEFCFHLGAQTLVPVASKVPLATFEANVMGTAHVLEAARRHPSFGTRIVVASSDKAYGSAGERAYIEDLPLMGTQPYDASKSAAEMVIRSYSQVYTVPVVTLRCANTYGPGDLNWSRLIPGALRAVLRGETLEIRSDGTPRRDYMHVDDAVTAYLLAASRFDELNLAGEAFNAGTGIATSVLELTGVIDGACRAAGVGALNTRVLGTAQHEIPFQVLDATKMRSRLGWSPSTSLSDGLARTIPWYREAITR